MTDHHDHQTDTDELDALIDDHLLHLEGGARRPDLDDLRPELRPQAAELIELLDASWGALTVGDAVVAVARSLGLSRDPFALSGSKLRQVRKAARLELKDLAATVTTIGITGVDTSALFDLEQLSAVWVDPALASALAVALDVDAPVLASASPPEPDDIDRFVASARFEEAVAAWALEQGRDPEVEATEIRQLVRSATYRAESVDLEHLEEILAAILRARARK